MATKKAVAKKPVKRTTKKTVAAKSSRKSAKNEMQSFRVAKYQGPFLSLQITKQTLYWVLLMLVIIVSQLWILKLQMDIATLTDVLLTQ